MRQANKELSCRVNEQFHKSVIEYSRRKEQPLAVTIRTALINELKKDNSIILPIQIKVLRSRVLPDSDIIALLQFGTFSTRKISNLLNHPYNKIVEKLNKLLELKKVTRIIKPNRFGTKTHYWEVF